jgi:hypothetical protein
MQLIIKLAILNTKDSAQVQCPDVDICGVANHVGVINYMECGVSHWGSACFIGVDNYIDYHVRVNNYMEVLWLLQSDVGVPTHMMLMNNKIKL